MASFKSASHVRFARLSVALLIVLGSVAISAVPAVAQDADSDLSKQLSQLQAQVMRLEAALNHQPQAAASMALQPSAAGTQATVQEQRTPGVPAGMQIAASFQNCLQCHQSRPPGPLPASHLQALSGQGGSQVAGGQQPSGAGMGQMSQGGQAMQGGSGGMEMGGDKKMGMGGMGMGSDKKMGMGGMGMGGDKKMGMGGDKKMGMGMMGGGKGMMGGGMGMMGGGMKMGGGSQDSQGMGAMGGGDSMSGADAAPIEAQLKSMQQQIQQLQQQVQQMMQIQMQMQLIQMKSMQSN